MDNKHLNSGMFIIRTILIESNLMIFNISLETLIEEFEQGQIGKKKMLGIGTF